MLQASSSRDGRAPEGQSHPDPLGGPRNPASSTEISHRRDPRVQSTFPGRSAWGLGEQRSPQPWGRGRGRGGGTRLRTRARYRPRPSAPFPHWSPVTRGGQGSQEHPRGRVAAAEAPEPAAGPGRSPGDGCRWQRPQHEAGGPRGPQEGKQMRWGWGSRVCVAETSMPAVVCTPRKIHPLPWNDKAPAGGPTPPILRGAVSPTAS